MNIRTITLFGIILNIICIIKGQKRIILPTKYNDNNNCIHTSGQPGLCVLFPKCHRHLIGPDLNGNTCGFEGNSPKICCPDQNPLQVFSPKLNFECGEANWNNEAQIFEKDNKRVYRNVFYSDYLNNRGYGAGATEASRFHAPPIHRRHSFGSVEAIVGHSNNVGHGAGATEASRFHAPPIHRRHSFGSVEAIGNEWPWAVLVGVQINLTDSTWFCTGSLINRKFVLSAAHCETKSPDIIRLGEHSILNDTDGAYTEESNIINTFINPHYETFPSYHDLVLFEMEVETEFSPYSINPICLPWSDTKQINFIRKKMTFVGWGATEFRGELSDVLLQADVESFDANVCDENYKTLLTYERNWPQGITEEFYICAGNQTASVDTCEGDSGGPLMYKEGNKYVIGGVTSIGYGCGNPKFPGLYINLRNTKYLQWIKDIAFTKVSN